MNGVHASALVRKSLMGDRELERSRRRRWRDSTLLERCDPVPLQFQQEALHVVGHARSAVQQQHRGARPRNPAAQPARSCEGVPHGAHPKAARPGVAEPEALKIGPPGPQESTAHRLPCADGQRPACPTGARATSAVRTRSRTTLSVRPDKRTTAPSAPSNTAMSSRMLSRAKRKTRPTGNSRNTGIIAQTGMRRSTTACRPGATPRY